MPAFEFRALQSALREKKKQQKKQEREFRKDKRDVHKKRDEFIERVREDRENEAANPEDFLGSGILPDEVIRKDIAYAEGRAADFGPPKFLASALELVVNRGIDSDLFFSTTEEDETIESISTSKFDDYANRVDTAATIHTQSGEDLTFAIDLYSGQDPEKAIGKIAKSSNIKGSNLFAGFTEIRYYQDSEGKKRLTNVPRYCIGVDKTSILSAVDEIAENKRIIDIVSMNEIKFKMLYEMSQQNGLYESYLYEYEDNFQDKAKRDKAFQKSLKTMTTLDNIYLRELDKVKKTLGGDFVNMSIDQIAEYFMKSDATFKTIVEATRTLQKEKESEQEEKKNYERARKSGMRIVQLFNRRFPKEQSA